MEYKEVSEFRVSSFELGYISDIMFKTNIPFEPSHCNRWRNEPANAKSKLYVLCQQQRRPSKTAYESLTMAMEWNKTQTSRQTAKIFWALILIGLLCQRKLTLFYTRK